jgi:hypothetical protein
MAGGPLCSRPPRLRPLRSDLGIGALRPHLGREPPVCLSSQYDPERKSAGSQSRRSTTAFTGDEQQAQHLARLNDLLSMRYWIISLALSGIPGGIFKPKVFAVFMLPPPHYGAAGLNGDQIMPEN